jgi:hypothetical protein
MAYFSDHRNSVRRSGYLQRGVLPLFNEADGAVYFERFQAYGRIIVSSDTSLIVKVLPNLSTDTHFPFLFLGSLSKAHGSTQQTYLGLPLTIPF